MDEFGLSEYDSMQITNSKKMSDYLVRSEDGLSTTSKNHSKLNIKLFAIYCFYLKA